MLFSSTFFVLASFVVSGLSATIGGVNPVPSPVPTTIPNPVADIKASIVNVSKATTALDDAIRDFPVDGGTVELFEVIRILGGNKCQAINVTIIYIKKLIFPLSQEDGKSIFSSVLAIEPTMTSALAGIVEKKPALEALPVVGIRDIIFQDLTTLSATTNGFESALTDALPVPYKNDSVALKQRLDVAYSQALAAYA